MALHTLKFKRANTSGRNLMSVVDFSILSKKKPEKKLLSSRKRFAGRDQSGRISVRHRGGGSKRKYRQISFLNQHLDEQAIVQAIEYDPFRSAFIALISWEKAGLAYILAWEKIKVNDKVIAQEKGEIEPGNRLLVKNIPTGINIYDVELHPGQGGKLVRSAGATAKIIAKEGNWVNIKMPSGEIRKISGNAFASIGQVSNVSNMQVRIGKAGRRRHQGFRPTVRGKAMHPAAHPHGGGEGVNPIGLKYPKTPWGKHALGVKTRKKHKYSDKMIVQRRQLASRGRKK